MASWTKTNFEQLTDVSPREVPMSTASDAAIDAASVAVPYAQAID